MKATPRRAVARHISMAAKKEQKVWRGDITEGYSLRLNPPISVRVKGKPDEQLNRLVQSWKKTVGLLRDRVGAKYICHSSETQIEFIFQTERMKEIVRRKIQETAGLW